MKLIKHEEMVHNSGYFQIGEIISYKHTRGKYGTSEYSKRHWEEKIIAIERCKEPRRISCEETNHCTGQILITDAKRPYGQSTTRWCGIESDFLPCSNSEGVD